MCLLATRFTPGAVELKTGICAREGWDVVCAPNGEDALRLLKVRIYDAVLLDEDLPAITGSRVVSQFREWEKTNRVTRQKNLTFMSDHLPPTESGGSTFIQLPRGVDNALGKPWDMNRIYSALATAETTSDEFQIVLG